MGAHYGVLEKTRKDTNGFGRKRSNYFLLSLRNICKMVKVRGLGHTLGEKEENGGT